MFDYEERYNAIGVAIVKTLEEGELGLSIPVGLPSTVVGLVRSVLTTLSNPSAEDTLDRLDRRGYLTMCPASSKMASV